jgi:Spy/CpxP family protein refolding chaperone
MARGFFVRCAAVLLVGATLAVASASVAPERAQAQVSPVESLPKGTIGLGLMGVELGLIVPALFGARDWWPYLVFPVLGGAGGAVGGYFLDVNTRTQPEISVAMMAIGMALLVPTIIGTLALTAYSPPTDTDQGDEDMQYEEQGDSVDAVQEETSATPAEESPQSRLERRVRALYAGGPGLVRFHRGALLIGAPIVASLPTFTAEEVERLHLQQGSDVVVPVMSASF